MVSGQGHKAKVDKIIIIFDIMENYKPFLQVAQSFNFF